MSNRGFEFRFSESKDVMAVASLTVANHRDPTLCHDEAQRGNIRSDLQSTQAGKPRFPRTPRSMFQKFSSQYSEQKAEQGEGRLKHWKPEQAPGRKISRNIERGVRGAWLSCFLTFVDCRHARYVFWGPVLEVRSAKLSLGAPAERRQEARAGR